MSPPFIKFSKKTKLLVILPILPKSIKFLIIYAAAAFNEHKNAKEATNTSLDSKTNMPLDALQQLKSRNNATTTTARSKIDISNISKETLDKILKEHQKRKRQAADANQLK